ncbi:hypothetical protein [Acidisoma sp. 7E03]
MTFTGVDRLQEEDEAPAAPSFGLHRPPAPLTFPFLDHLLGCMIAAGQGIQALCLFLQLTRDALDLHIVRLGLATPHDRPVRKAGPKAWSTADVILAILLRLAGVHPESIGAALSQPRSANAVRTKLRRMGIRGPGRKELFKVDPSSLRLPHVGMMTDLLRSQTDFSSTTRELRRFVTSGRTQSSPTGSLQSERNARPSNASGEVRQRELPLMGLVGGRDKAAKLKAAAAARNPVPVSEDAVNFSDLSWFKSLVGKSPLKNRVAVYVVGMLALGGLHYKEAAKRLGVSAASYRTFRTRMDVPVDPDRSKAGEVFDEEAAKVTLARSGYEVRLCMRSQQNWFWAKKADKGLRVSPPLRSKERFIGERGNRIEILTRAMLDAENKFRRMPFAKSEVRVCA